MPDTLFENANDTSVFNENYPIADLGEILSAVKPTAQMIASVKKHGVINPITLRGKEVVAGRRRVLASIAAGRKTIPARIFPENYSNKHILSLVENEQRRANPLSDLRSIEALLDANMTDEEICAEVGCNKQRLRKILTIRKLVPHLRKAFEDGIIRFSVAELVSKKPKHVQEKVLELLQNDGEVKLKDVHAICKVQKKAAFASLPDSLFGSLPTPAWKTQVEQKLREIKKLAEKDAEVEWVEKLEKLMETL